MQGKASPRSDRGVQRVVLALALDAHPEPLTTPDLAREIDLNGVEQAVADLVVIGLLECEGLTIKPSATALHFERLELP